MLKLNIYNCKAIDDVKIHRNKCTNKFLFGYVLILKILTIVAISYVYYWMKPVIFQSQNYLVYQICTLATHLIKLNLGHTQLVKCDASSIVKKLLVNKNFNINNCIAMETYNRSFMEGINNGVCAKL